MSVSPIAKATVTKYCGLRVSFPFVSFPFVHDLEYVPELDDYYRI